MAQVEKIKKILDAAYPGCTVKVLTDSWYRGDGPDGYQDEYCIAAFVGGEKVWEHFFADFTYDASGGFEPDPDWERIEADNLRQYCRFSLREY